MAYFEGTGDHTNTVSGVIDPPQNEVVASDASMSSVRAARRLREPAR
jgi:hypothetical protein